MNRVGSPAEKDRKKHSDEIEWDEVQVDNYSPSIFEDIEASRRTIIRSPGFVVRTGAGWITSSGRHSPHEQPRAGQDPTEPAIRREVPHHRHYF